VILVLAAGLLGVAKFAGCDMSGLGARVERNARAMQEEAGRKRDYLRGLLPSATFGGMGVFFGFRRKAREMAPASPPTQ
jgi:hypothetical protein